MPINSSFTENIITPQDTVTQLNSATSGQFGIVFVFLTFIAGFFLWKDEPMENILIYNGALTSTIAGGLIILQYVPFEYLMIGLFTLGSGIMLKLIKRG